MKRLGILGLIAIASATLIADRSIATPRTSWSAANLSDLRGGHDERNVNSLFNAVGLAASSYSVSSGTLTLEAKVITTPTKQVALFHPIHILGNALGPRSEIIGIKIDTIGPVTSRPIPEARTILLYALGSLAVAWALVRSRRFSDRAI